MRERLTPEFFCGSAMAALTGLLFGLMLHIPWQKHPGGPQILSRAQAAEAHPAKSSPANAVAGGPAELADFDDGPVPPDPLPVVRLRPEMFDTQPAAADDAERRDVDELLADEAPPPPSHDLD